MSFQDAVATCFHKYADPHGRASRAEYWWFILFCFIVSVLAGIIDAVVGSVVVGVIVSLALLLPQIMVGIRRLHDINRTGLWMFIGLVPLVGAIVLLVFFLTDGTYGDNKYGPRHGLQYA
jgi:uncharacterized membrane protein YhaH (DUF805 family)